ASGRTGGARAARSSSAVEKVAPSPQASRTLASRTDISGGAQRAAMSTARYGVHPAPTATPRRSIVTGRSVPRRASSPRARGAARAGGRGGAGAEGARGVRDVGGARWGRGGTNPPAPRVHVWARGAHRQRRRRQRAPCHGEEPRPEHVEGGVHVTAAESTMRR